MFPLDLQEFVINELDSLADKIESEKRRNNALDDGIQGDDDILISDTIKFLFKFQVLSLQTFPRPTKQMPPSRKRLTITMQRKI